MKFRVFRGNNFAVVHEDGRENERAGMLEAYRLSG
jgi:hypothetical protein